MSPRLNPRFDIDYSLLDQQENPTLKLTKAQLDSSFVKVAFDIFRPKDGGIEDLWSVEKADDGFYFVARYSDVDEETTKQASTKPSWEVLVKNGSDVNVFYKNIAITKFLHNDAETIKNYLPKKLASDKSYVEALLNTLSSTRKQEILKLYPELA